MDSSGRALRSVLAAALVIALAATTGCAAWGRSSGDQAGVTAPEPGMSYDSAAGGASGDMAVAPQATQEQKAAAPTDRAAAGSDGERLIVRNASLSLRVDDIDKGLQGVRSAASRNGAEIADLSVDAGNGVVAPDAASSSSGPAVATITLRVPADKLDALRSALAGIGEVTAQSESSSDVTEQAIDMEARLKNLRAQESRLREFFDRATKVSDLLAIEQELARVRGDIESMDAQLTYLKRQAARATLTVSLSEPSPVVSPVGTDWGFRAAVTTGIRGAALILATLLTLIIALLPLALIVLLVVLFVRNRRRRHATSESLTIETTESVESDEST